MSNNENIVNHCKTTEKTKHIAEKLNQIKHSEKWERTSFSEKLDILHLFTDYDANVVIVDQRFGGEYEDITKKYKKD